MKNNKFFGHLKTILTHKYWVFYFARRLGIGWQGFWHDMSKFHPVEFWESIKYYTGIRSPIDVCKEQNGYSMAWLHHKSNNKHHYEYWQDNFDSGTTHLCMPDKYVKELLCDYLGAGMAYTKGDYSFNGALTWWNKKRVSVAMHPNQILFLDEFFGWAANTFGDNKFKSDTFKDYTTWKNITNKVNFYLNKVHNKKA